MKKTLWKLVAVLVIAVLVHAPGAYASCGRYQCVSPCVSHPLVYDSNFDNGTECWTTTGDSTISGGVASVDSGQVYQEFYVDAYTSFHLAIYINGIYGDAGTERYRVFITSGGSTELVDVFWPYENPSGRYDYDINNYSNSTIRVTIGVLPGLDPGTSWMDVEWLEIWGRDF